ncbi:MAG: flagellar protein FlgN [Magnetospirillum sp.]|nr:MAG: flagellar protein FlgN [Magnetospirillum sp.]
MIHDDEDFHGEDELHDEDAVHGGPIIAFDDLVFACSNLCDLLEIENEALASHDSDTVKVLVDNKVALAKLYEQAVQPLVTSPELAETLEPEQRDELLEVGMRLKELMGINEIRLRAEMEAYQRVMDILANAAKKQGSNVTTYGRAGTFDSPGGTGASLSFNKSL